MKQEDFDLFATLLKQRSGYVLTREKNYFLESRMLPLIRKYSMKSTDDLASVIRSRREESLMAEVTEAMMSFETSFFRDHTIFSHIKKNILPHFRASRAAKKQLRLWSMGVSSGQEAYSLAVQLLEMAADFEGWKIDIIATDISKAAIARAKTGIYTQLEVQRGLPIQMLVKYFQNIGGDKWQINEALRQKIHFREANILHDFGPVGVFDLILCRNVMSGFEELTQRHVLETIHAVMAPDGVLICGANEHIAGITDKKYIPGGAKGIYNLGAHDHLATQAI